MFKLLLVLSLISAIQANGCPRGYTYYSGCYQVISTPLTWQSAILACTQTGGIIATIPNAFTNAWLLNFTNSAPCDSDLNWYWIGLNSYFTAFNDWSWLDGSSLTYRNWLPGKPVSDHRTFPLAGLIGRDGRWIDIYFNAVFCTICSAYPNTTNTVQLCESGWTYYAPTHSCYKNFVSETFAHAENICIQMGAHVSSIHSVAENEFIINLVQTGLDSLPATKQVWVGMNRVGDNWVNVDGSPADYKNFGAGYPKAATGTNNCAILFADPDESGFVEFWQDTTCTQRQRAYVCKMPANG